MGWLSIRKMMLCGNEDVGQSLMMSRRIGCERLGFELTLLLVKRKGVMDEARFILTDNAATGIWITLGEEEEENRNEGDGEIFITRKNKEEAIDAC